MLLFDPEERWVLFVGLCNVVGGFIVDVFDVFVFGFGLLTDLLIILSTANGDVDIFGTDEPVRSASLRKEPAGDFSDGSFVANCCCCCLEWFTDDVDEELGRSDNDKSLFEEEWVFDFDDSFDCFLYCENKSIVRSTTEEDEEFIVVELRFVVESDWDDGETIAGFAIGRIISDLFVLFDDCSDNWKE